jgi:hypothetical protein
MANKSVGEERGHGMVMDCLAFGQRKIKLSGGRDGSSKARRGRKREGKGEKTVFECLKRRSKRRRAEVDDGSGIGMDWLFAPKTKTKGHGLAEWWAI